MTGCLAGNMDSTQKKLLKPISEFSKAARYDVNIPSSHCRKQNGRMCVYISQSLFLQQKIQHCDSTLQLKKPKLVAFLSSMNNLKTKKKIPFIIVSKRIKDLGMNQGGERLVHWKLQNAGPQMGRFNTALPELPRGIDRFNAILVKTPNAEIGKFIRKLRQNLGIPLVVQWLRPSASTAGSSGSIPGQETKTPHAAQRSQKKKNPMN